MLLVKYYLFIHLFVKQHYCVHTPKYCEKRFNSLTQNLTSNARLRLNYDTGSIANILSLAWLHFMMVLGAQWMIVHTREGLLECCKCVQHFRGRDTNDHLALEVTHCVSMDLLNSFPDPKNIHYRPNYSQMIMLQKWKAPPVQPSSWNLLQHLEHYKIMIFLYNNTRGVIHIATTVILPL